MAKEFKDVCKDDQSLLLLLKKLKEFESAFCEAMIKGSDYTIRLEARGNKGVLVHVRCNADAIDKPEKS